MSDRCDVAVLVNAPSGTVPRWCLLDPHPEADLTWPAGVRRVQAPVTTERQLGLINPGRK